jgi:hypothetical protein
MLFKMIFITISIINISQVVKMDEGFNYESQLKGGNARYVYTNFDKHILHNVYVKHFYTESFSLSPDSVRI